MTAMFAVTPAFDPLSIVMPRNSRLALAPITLAGIVSTRRFCWNPSSCSSCRARSARRAFLLVLHLQLAELPLQLIVLGADAAKISVAAPGVANAAGDACGAALHLGERAEGDHLEQRHAGA